MAIVLCCRTGAEIVSTDVVPTTIYLILIDLIVVVVVIIINIFVNIHIILISIVIAVIVKMIGTDQNGDGIGRLSRKVKYRCR